MANRGILDMVEGISKSACLSPALPEAYMLDRRYAISDAPCDRAPNARGGPRRPIWRFSAVVCAAALLASCAQQGVLDPQGPIASAQLLLLKNATEIMLVVVVPVILASVGWSLWYRSSNARAKRREDLFYEGRIDFVSWAIPLLTVMLLSSVNWISSHDLDPRTPIAATVMSSFLVPQLGSQTRRVSGANFNGNGFADMRFIAKAVPAADFAGWVAHVRGSGTALDIPAYAALAKPSQAVPPTTWRSVDPELFERIVEQTALGPQKHASGGAWHPTAPPAGG
jgi:cytochrome o ubiquinol oxidase subunit II